MNLLPTLLLLALSCSPIVCAQASPHEKIGGERAASFGSKARLQLTTSIVERKPYCSNSEGFKLRLTFKNVGPEPVVLDRRSFIARRLVSRDLKAAASRQYELSGRFDYFDGAYFLADPSDTSNFVLLKPGEVYDLDASIGSFSVYDGEKDPPQGHLVTGTHYLQLEVGTWSYVADPEPFLRQWSDKGFLWIEGLTSLPMPFTVGKDRPAVKCP